MPSCVVKWCKNNTTLHKKCLGITFHRFPIQNKPWKDDWLRIIRNCRGQEDWIPSKSSVVCSIHFDPNDLYTTSQGLRRVVTYAVPKLLLFEPLVPEEEQVDHDKEQQSSSTSEQLLYESPVPEEEQVDYDKEQQSSSISEQLLYEPPVQEEQHGLENETTSSLLGVCCDHDQEQQRSLGLDQVPLLPPMIPLIVSDQPSGSCMPLSSARIPPQPTTELDCEQPLLWDSPRKLRLKKIIEKKKTLIETHRKKIKLLNQKVRRLHNRNQSLKDILKQLKQKNFIDIDLYKNLNQDIIAVNIFNNYNRKKLKKHIKYTQTMKKFCLTLNFYSPKAYDYVRQTFNTCLPHRKTLAKWYGHIEGTPGFTEESFRALKAKAQVSQHRPICSLVFDEVAIKPQKIWDGRKYIGLVDMGTGVKEGAPEATQALVFLLVGINHRFKIPLGYFLCAGSPTAEQKANLIKVCLIKCFDSDVDVVSLTCDGHSTNTLALELLGCNLDPDQLKTTFKHPACDSEVAFFLDPSHVIKLIRNHFESKEEFLTGDNSKIKWNILKQLNKLQEEEGLHLANKLTKKHINFKNNIMKVKLATQVFSASVAKALKICREELKIPDFLDSAETENFITKVNDMFDIFNSRAMTEFNFKKPICSQNKDEIFKFLNELKEYVSNLKIKASTKRKMKNDEKRYLITRYYKPVVKAQCNKGFIGILINIESLKYIYETLIENEKRLIFLPTYKLSQDHLEIFFSCIRMQCGSNDNPNVRQFKGGYRKLLAHLEIKCFSTGNCVPLEQLTILNCSSATQIINSTTPSYRHKEEDDSVSSLKFLEKIPECDTELIKRLDIEEFNDFRKLIVGYVAGSVVHFINRTIKCCKCLARLSTSERLYFHKLISLKTKGRLIFPSEDMYKICNVCEMVVRKLVKENITLYNETQHKYILNKILEKFMSNNNHFFNLEKEHAFAGLEHKISLIKCIAEKFLSIRFHHISKIEGISRSADSKRQVYKKLTQHKGF